jgi:hypothetical protein
VAADGPGSTSGCGAAGRQVTFQVDSRDMAPAAQWDVSQVWALPLRPETQKRLFLPMTLRFP